MEKYKEPKYTDVLDFFNKMKKQNKKGVNKPHDLKAYKNDISFINRNNTYEYL